MVILWVCYGYPMVLIANYPTILSTHCWFTSQLRVNYLVSHIFILLTLFTTIFVAQGALLCCLIIKNYRFWLKKWDFMQNCVFKFARVWILLYLCAIFGSVVERVGFESLKCKDYMRMYCEISATREVKNSNQFNLFYK